MGLIQRFLLGNRVDDDLQVGLFLKNDGTVWLRNPDGSETQVSGGGGGGSLGVWKTYGVDSSNQPIGGITLGDGQLNGVWWTPGPVVASSDTPPFLCIIVADLTLGDTTTVDGPFSFSLPTLVDGSEFDMTKAFGEPNGFAEASGIGDFPGTAIGNAGFVGGDGTAWDATHPFVWAAAHNLMLSVTFQAVFTGD